MRPSAHKLLLFLIAVPLLAGAAKPRTGRLSVAVSVPDADIFIDGALITRSPMGNPVRLRVGDHSIKVAKSGHTEFIDVVKIRDGELTELSVELIPMAAVLEVASTPPGALLFVDGKAVGQTPWRGEVDAGDRELRLVLDGYLEAGQQVSCVAGETYPLTIALTAAPPPPAAARALPLHRRWWFWAGVGATAASVLTLSIVLSSDGDPLSGADRVVTPEW